MLSLSFRSLISFLPSGIFGLSTISSDDSSSPPYVVGDDGVLYDTEDTRKAYSVANLPEEHRDIFSEGYQGGPSPLDYLMEDEDDSPSDAGVSRPPKK